VVERTPAIEIDAALVAPRLGLTVAEFRQLMDQRRITVLCERGVGEDTGRYRASFYYGDRRVRLVVDTAGGVCDRISSDAP
jgi:hypothetical protein